MTRPVWSERDGLGLMEMVLSEVWTGRPELGNLHKLHTRLVLGWYFGGIWVVVGWYLGATLVLGWCQGGIWVVVRWY